MEEDTIMSMPTVAEMMSWNYEEAFNFFMAKGGMMKDYWKVDLADKYVRCVYNCKVSTYVSDFIRALSRAKAAIKRFIEFAGDSTLIVIDGESGTGKTTFAKKLCEKRDFVFLDYDECAKNFFEEYLKSSNKSCYIVSEELVDDLLAKHLEDEVKKRSNNGQKTVVLVGAFRNIVLRTIIVNTIGSCFQRKISLVIHDKLEDNIRRIKARSTYTFPEEIELATRMYNDMEYFRITAIHSYGIGFDVSFWVSHEAVRDYEFQ